MKIVRFSGTVTILLMQWDFSRTCTRRLLFFSPSVDEDGRMFSVIAASVF